MVLDAGPDMQSYVPDQICSEAFFMWAAEDALGSSRLGQFCPPLFENGTNVQCAKHIAKEKYQAERSNKRSRFQSHWIQFSTYTTGGFAILLTCLTGTEMGS